MTGYDRRLRLLAACLSAVAGYVDAIGFIRLGGFFVSFMSGNTTRVGVGLAESGAAAKTAASLILIFILGVISGAVVGRMAKAHRRPMVLLFVCGLLALAAIAAGLGDGRLAVAAMVLAMGAENAVFSEDGEVRIGVTYMTGTLVKLGKRITAALYGGDPLGWAPYLLLWLGLLAGAFLGATAYSQMGLTALWGAALAAGALSLVAAKIGPDAA
ncbi:YoaK family protein [Phenylobacterium sp. LjRoot225]|uniref:YoaK family protein n=1 Tax=Phenylobacterium sp. LjRoot225 TaxID=3342285 RepID=UPI003ED13EC3